MIGFDRDAYKKKYAPKALMRQERLITERDIIKSLKCIPFDMQDALLQHYETEIKATEWANEVLERPELQLFGAE